MTGRLAQFKRKSIYYEELKGLIDKGSRMEYEQLYAAFKSLIDDGIVLPVKSSGYNGRTPPLHRRFWINHELLNRDDEPEKQLLLLSERLSTQYYSHHIPQFKTDRKIIKVFDACFKGKQLDKRVERRERAFELFGDEKALDEGGDCFKVMKRLGLSLDEDLNTFERRLPLTFFPFNKRVKSLLIVENLTPFYDAFLLMRKFNTTHLHSPFDALALGNGYHILMALEFINDLLEDPEDLSITYWGDIDAAGVEIFCKLGERYPDFTIELWERAYREMLLLNKTRADKSTLKMAFEKTDDELLNRIMTVVMDGKAIPQEAVDYERIGELLEQELTEDKGTDNG